MTLVAKREPMHPKAVEALVKAEGIRLQREQQERHHESTVRLYGLKFVHIRPEPGKSIEATGATIAYAPVRAKGGRDMIHVAIALQHPKDVFSKKIGRMTAAAHFEGCNAIRLRVPRGMSVPTFLKHTFSLTTIL